MDSIRLSLNLCTLYRLIIARGLDLTGGWARLVGQAEPGVRPGVENFDVISEYLELI